MGERANAELPNPEQIDRAVRACTAACTSTARALREAGVPPEALAELVPEGRRLRILRRPATMRPLCEVWRLGSLLLGTDPEHPTLYAAGRATRAAERGRPNYQDLAREGRRDLAAAALNGGYAVGTPVNFDATPLPLEAQALLALGPDSPIGVSSTEIRVRWRPSADLTGAPTLERYLEERAGLLIDPPFSPS